MNKEIVVEMNENYPFGELGQTITEETRVLVQKTLHFGGQEQLDLIKQMINFIKAIPHPALISLEHILEGQEEIHLQYQYVPFRLEKWLLTVNEDLIQKVQEQLMDLAEFLVRSSVKFVFNPSNVGINADMNVKYFLSEFSVDVDDEEERKKQVMSQIKMFILELKQAAGKVGSEEQVKSARFGSLSTNASISPLDGFISFTKSLPTGCEATELKKRVGISTKVQNSMQKSLEVLAKLKKKNQK